MYLKSLEMTGFKSFADRTLLEFDRGMTAVVGPNGCGKSNIVDALRWVLGEQSAKAMRSEQMADVIFNGTETRKPLGMAEVSVTFAECEQALGIEYHEVTVTRRVFRSGESQYFLNKTPCRLKDIQRLFMGTGIGTLSYSVMQQGRIDQVLSSRPEDRREVFEEASGITRYKADKREALRKLEQTEANLARLADVLREVKRQIISLQRQAGKARRYKALRSDLKALDIYASRLRVALADRDIAEIEQQRQGTADRIEQLQRAVGEAEADLARIRERLAQTEREMASALEATAQARERLEHTRELIRVNTQRAEECRARIARETQEVARIETQLRDRDTVLRELAEERAAAERHLQEAEQTLRQAVQRGEQHGLERDQVRSRIERLREESLQLEAQMAHLENDLLDLDRRQRAEELARERTAAERSRLQHEADLLARRRSEIDQAIHPLRVAAEEAATHLAAAEADHRQLIARRAALHEEGARLRAQAAALEARATLLREACRQAEGEETPGARRLLDRKDVPGVLPTAVFGCLADSLRIAEPYRRALEAVLRFWLDAVVVADGQVLRAALRGLQGSPEASVRLLTAAGPTPQLPPIPAGAQRLSELVDVPEGLRSLINRWTGHVAVFDSLDQIPEPLSPGLMAVTRDGVLLHGQEAAEIWQPARPLDTPLGRRQALAETEQEIVILHERLQAVERETSDLEHRIRTATENVAKARAAVEAAARVIAQKEGEAVALQTEANRIAERLETVTWEIEAARASQASSPHARSDVARRMEEHRSRRQQIHDEIRVRSDILKTVEARHQELQQEITEHRLRCSTLGQKRNHLQQQHETLIRYQNELTKALEVRRASAVEAEKALQNLLGEIRAAEEGITTLAARLEELQTRQEALRHLLAETERQRVEAEQRVAEQRAALDAAREARAKFDVRLAESRIRRQNLLDRLVNEYGGSAEQILQEPDPVWDGDPMTLEAADAAVVELRAKLEALGPVNLVAIEEYEEQERRLAFLSAQERDLVASKEQLVEMIRKLNRTTTEMFRSTFDRINENFQAMFVRLFGGGSAKLVLADEDDILECGIEILVRPPGRKIQSVAPLSGGERTLVAIALLFAIYQIKPSPFCFLDEMDAALDDSNIGRFIDVLKDFVHQSQFVVITHNRQTMAAADILYGVTMPEKGVSKIVSVRFGKPNASEPQQTKPASAPSTEPPPSPESHVLIAEI